MKFDDKTKKQVARALETLLLADHLGDAHDAGLALAKLVFGKKGEYAYQAYAEGDRKAFFGMKEFDILGDEEDE